MGRYAEAEPLYRRSLEIDEKEFGPNHTEVAADLNNLAILYKAMGRYSDAEPLYRRALEITEKLLGRDHSEVAKGLNNLATLYTVMGRYADAEPLARRSLEIMEHLGPDHPEVAMVGSTWRPCTGPWAVTPRPSCSLGGAWRSWRSTWGPTTPTWLSS